MDRALEAANGIVLHFGSASGRKSFRSKCYSVRANDRSDSAKVYATGDPGHSVSEYDKIRLTDENKDDEPIIDSDGEEQYHLLLINVNFINIIMYDGKTGEPVTNDEAAAELPEEDKSPYDLS